MAQERLPSRPAENPKPLQPVVFPGFAEKIFGKDFLDGIKKLAMELEEYEIYARDKTLALWEIAEYLQAIGFIDECRERTAALKMFFKKNHDAALEKWKKESYSDTNAKWSKTVQDVFFQPVFAKERPLLTALLSELVQTELLMSVQESLEASHKKAETDSIAAQVLRDDPLGAERALYLATDQAIRPDQRNKVTIPCANHFFIHSLKHRNTTMSSVSDGASVFEMGRYAMRNEIEDGEYSLSIPGFPWVNEIKLVKGVSATNPMVWGQISILWNQWQKKFATGFNLSHFVPDPCGSGLMLTPVREIFEYYGIGEMYPKFFAALYRAIEEGLTSGKIPMKKDLDQETLEEALEAAESMVDDSVVDDDVEEVRDEVRAVEVSTDEPVLREVVPEAVRVPKVGFQRNIQFLKAKAAFQRLGVTIDVGGKHLILSYESRSAAFPKMSSGETRGVSYLVKSALKMLGISKEAFIAVL